MIKIISSTGCVHAVNTDHMHSFTKDNKKRRATMCNHANYYYSYGEQYYHAWPVTTSEVNCKRCIASIKRITDKMETDWTLKNTNCYHRLQHTEFGIMCTEPKRTNYCRLHRPKSFRKCLKQHCPISFHRHKPVKKHPLELDPGPMVKMIEYILTTLGEEIVEADRRSKARFTMVSSHCPFRKPTKMVSKKVDTVYQCKNPKLEDPNFGWSCDMGNCPWMDRAMDWRANNLP